MVEDRIEYVRAFVEELARSWGLVQMKLKEDGSAVVSSWYERCSAWFSRI